MPFALVVIGLIMIVTGIQNTYSQFATQAASDSKGFVKWMIAIGSVGALGYVQELRQFSHYFMALILVSMVLANKGLFQNFQNAISAGPTTPQAGATQNTVSSTASTSTINSAITTNQSSLFGDAPTTAGQAKFNGWMNYLFGTGVSASTGN